MKHIRVGVIGVGNIGAAHARAIYQGEIKGMCLKALCDINEENVKRLKEEYSDCRVFRDYKELIKSGDVDAVIVSVPHNIHCEIDICALENNLHLLVEKPVDVSVTKAKKLNELKISNGAYLSAWQNNKKIQLPFDSDEFDKMLSERIEKSSYTKM